MSEFIDNRRYRIEKLKEIIKGLHHGEDPEKVRAKLLTLVKETDASEIAAMEQQLMAEGMPAEEVTRMCDLHSEVLREITVDHARPSVPPGHPVDTFLRENKAIQKTIHELRAGLLALTFGPDENFLEKKILSGIKNKFSLLMDLEKHYSRKENLLFPFLEKHGNTGPSRVMWAKDDEVRDLLKGLGAALAAENVKIAEWKIVAATVAEPALKAAEEMIYKEEHILLPMAQEVLTEAEWEQIREQSPEIGYAMIEPEEASRPGERKTRGKTEKGTPSAGSPGPEQPGKLVTPTGALTMAQMKGILRALPVDLTFVDDKDEVRYFTESAERIFVRSKSILGRKIQYCHPPSSLHVVEKIVEDFRAGRKNACSFWIEYQGRFVYIRYFAIRDEDEKYLGTLEVTQDLTKERALTGEKRLLQYDEDK